MANISFLIIIIVIIPIIGSSAIMSLSRGLVGQPCARVEGECMQARRSSVKSALSSLSFLIIISVIIGLIVSIVIIVIIVITAPIVIVVMRRISIMIHDPTVIIIIRTMQVFMLSRGPMVIGEIGAEESNRALLCVPA